MSGALSTVRRRVSQIRSLHTRFGGLIRDQRRLLALSFVALAGEVGFQILTPFPIKYIFDGLLMPVQGASLVGVPDGWAQQHPYVFLGLACGALLLFPACAGICSSYRIVWSATAGQRMVTELRRRLYGHLHRLSLRFHRDSRLGDLLLRITGDIPMLRDVLSQSFVELIGRLVSVAATLAILFVLDPAMAVVSVAALASVGSLSWVFSRRIVRVVKKQRRREGLLAYTAGESLATVAYVKALGREDAVIDRFSQQNQASLRKGLKATRLQAALSRWVEMVFGACVALVVLVGVGRILSGGSLTPGDLLVFVSLVRNLNKPLRKISRISPRIGKAAACGDRILEILRIEPEEIDLPGARPAPALTGAISLRGVDYSYDGTKPALSRVDLEIAPGESVAIVGRNGAGKTTLIHLLLRFYEPTSGRVVFDGIDARDLTIGSLRSQIAVALQGTYLFGTTIRENLLFAAPGKDDRAMLAALDLVAADFVRTSPAGLDTELSEGGANLSGGEKRKLALAAAVLREAPILILDEPTTHIDSGSREDILRKWPEITNGRTTLLITHDPAMLERVDRVVSLEGGRIAAAALGTA